MRLSRHAYQNDFFNDFFNDFPLQIYCSFLFDSKKMSDAMYMHYAIILYKYFDVAYKLKISKPKYLFL